MEISSSGINPDKFLSASGSGEEEETFLESGEAAPFLGVFRNIRLPHLVNHHMDVEILVSDRIIPNSWMTSIYYTRWMTLLRYSVSVFDPHWFQ
jgi:hypothetical protein